MKRLWIGVVLMAVLLGLGAVSTWGMDRVHTPVSRQLEDAARAAMEEDWLHAEEDFRQARRAWERAWHWSATVADHTPMEEIDGLFAQLEVFAQSRDPVCFAACCAQLSRQIRAMADAHELTWWNLL